MGDGSVDAQQRARATFADVWCAIPKVVFSRTLDSVEGNARLAEASLAEEVAAALDATDKDVSIGGAGLAAVAVELGLVDELCLFRYPIVVGGGTPSLLSVLGVEPSHADAELVEWDDWDIGATDREHPVTRGLHVGFRARDRAQVDAFWQAGVEAGYRDDGAPGWRTRYGPTYYGAFVLDPDGHNVEVVNHNRG